MLLTLLPLSHPLPLNSSSVWTVVSPRKYKKTVSFENLWVLQVQSPSGSIGMMWKLVRYANWWVPPQAYWTLNSGLGPSFCVLASPVAEANVPKSLKTTGVGSSKVKGERILKLVHNPFEMYPPRFSWWSPVGEATCQCRGHGFDYWSVNIPHADIPPHLSWCPVTAEAQGA